MLKNERGITLVALVITIIVLIILATVSLTLVFNEDSSILGGAQKAKDAAEADDEATNLFLQQAENLVVNKLEGAGITM